ncbi:MAG: NapC/NirT family cytochrome c [Myxococcota bacterium]
MIKTFFGAIFRSPLSLVGALLTTVSAVLFLTLFVAAELNPRLGGGYAGIVSFVILPGVFVLGLLLIPLGLARLRKKEREGGEARAPVIDLNVPRTRMVVSMVALLTLVNVVIVATATYKGVQTMESVEFCGGACHSVMSPEYTAYQRSPHSRVQCTRCHVGSGAEWFVRGKASGVDQLVSVALGTYPRPIPTPVEDMREAEETCEECHARGRVMRDRLSVIDRFEEDEGNTWKKTVLLNKVAKVHWHVGSQVRFRSDAKRLFVAELERPLPDGGVRRWKNEQSPDAGVSDEWRTMDCVDCHNRPAHAYQRPRDEVDRALASGAVDRTLPFIRREGLRVVQLPWPDHDAAKAGIRRELSDFYAKRYPDVAAARVDRAAEGLFELYRRNVFPSMNIGWGTYPDFRDHDGEGGCFRCHTSDLTSADGLKVSDRCELCHLTLAEEEESPEILELMSEE